MIKKLMKYDLKKMTRILIYIYLVSIAFASLTRLVFIWKDIQAVAILGYALQAVVYSAIGSILVNTFVHILKTFLDGFYKDESYLTHTLPVSKNKLLASKYLSSLITIFASVLVCFVSLFIMFYSKSFVLSLKGFIRATVANFNMSVGLFLFLMVAIIFSQICAIMSMAFWAVVKANTYNHKRVLKGLICFFIYYFASMILTLISIVVVFVVSGSLHELTASVLSQKAFVSILVIGLVLYVIYAIVFYFITRKLFNKGVNVD